jgi:S-adenosylmethionine synthetase
MVQTFGTGTVPDPVLEKIVAEVFDLTPRAIIDALKLKRPIYRPTASYGHFGRKPRSGQYDGKKVEFFTWEQSDRVKDLLSSAR